MIKEITTIEEANICDNLLTLLIQDERKYNDTIDENYVVKDHFSKLLDKENAKVLAYYLDNKIVGYILIRKTDDLTCLLDGLFVIDQYRNRGIGRKLINEAIKVCKTYKVKYVDINVMKNNTIAKKLYQELDFNELEIKMRKHLED